MDPLLIAFVIIAVALVLGPILLTRVIPAWKVQIVGGAFVAASAMFLLLVAALTSDAGTGGLLVPILLMVSGALTFASGPVQRKRAVVTPAPDSSDS